MRFDETNDVITLECSGRSFYAYSGALTVSEAGDRLPARLYYGFDGSVDDEDFTPAERKEIADEMVKLWRAWQEGA